jgi:hypothetical protein
MAAGHTLYREAVVKRWLVLLKPVRRGRRMAMLLSENKPTKNQNRTNQAMQE